MSPLLAEALTVALRAAEQTDGVVDPTVGHAGWRSATTATSPELDPDGADPLPAPQAAPGWWRVGWDGATARAPPRRRRSTSARPRRRCPPTGSRPRWPLRPRGGVLVSLGGDVSRRRAAPDDGWRIAVGDDHERALVDPELVVSIAAGGLATSSTTRRAWRRGGRTVHHIVDPRTGDVPVQAWRTVSVAAATCVDANTASTAAVVLGDAAPGWLADRRLPARLVDRRRRRHHDRGLAREESRVDGRDPLVRQPSRRA